MKQIKVKPGTPTKMDADDNPSIKGADQMDFLVLDKHSRNLLCLWLSGRERPYKISFVRWGKLKSGSTAKLSHTELAEILDLYGYHLLELLQLPVDAKVSLIRSMKFQIEKDGGLTPSADVRQILDIDRMRRRMEGQIG